MGERSLGQGDLQAHVMAALWQLDEGTVAQVRAALPSRNRGAYTTVQTVLNRLVERGLVTRFREGRSYIYRAALSEADAVSRAMAQSLGGASSEARTAAFGRAVVQLTTEELTDLLGLVEAELTARRRAGDGD